jgi:hypothetical protein
LFNISPEASRISLNTQPDCVIVAPIASPALPLSSQTETTMLHCHTHRHDALPRGHPALLVAPALRQPRRPVEHAAGRRKLVVGREAREKGLGTEKIGRLTGELARFIGKLEIQISPSNHQNDRNDTTNTLNPPPLYRRPVGNEPDQQQVRQLKAAAVLGIGRIAVGKLIVKFLVP